MGPLMRLEHGEEERSMLASDLAPHLLAWVQDSPLLHLEVKEKEDKEEEQVKRLETKLRLLAVHSRLLSTLLGSFPEKEVEQVTLLLPSFSYNAVDLLLKLLQTGTATAASLRDLETVVEVAESLNIHLDNLDFSGMYPEVKENNLGFSGMDLEVEGDNLTLTGINLEDKVEEVFSDVKKSRQVMPKIFAGVKEEEKELQGCMSETFEDIAEASAGIHTNEGVVVETKTESKADENDIIAAEENLSKSETSVSGGKSFGDRITVHERKSSKTLPYKCDVCGHEFNQKGNMKTHKINKHQYQPAKISNRVKMNNTSKEPFLYNSKNIHARYESVNQAFELVGNGGGVKNMDLIKVRNLQKPFRSVSNPPAQKVAFSNVHSKVKSLQKTFRTGSITISVDKEDTDQKSEDGKYFDKNCSVKTKSALNIVKGLTVTNPNLKLHTNESESILKSKPTNIELVVDKRIPAHKCSKCQKIFNFKEELRTHKKIHTQLICAECGKIFNDNSHLREHSLVHSDIRPFICDICGKSFTRLVLLNSHSSNTHSKK